MLSFVSHVGECFLDSCCASTIFSMLFGIVNQCFGGDASGVGAVSSYASFFYEDGFFSGIVKSKS